MNADKTYSNLGSPLESMDFSCGKPTHTSSKNDILVLDSDFGTDDAVAFLLLNTLPKKPDYIVSSFGNTSLEMALRNSVILKKRLGISAQIVEGLPDAIEPSIFVREKEAFHGEDGFGGISNEMAENLQISSEEFADYITFGDFRDRLAAADSITYITIGTLTNLASLLTCESLNNKIRKIIIMGGGINEFNCSNDTEFNFSKAPQAVRNVLESGESITLFPLDVTNHQTLSDDDIDRLETYGTYPEFISFLRYNRKANSKYNDIPYAVLHDALPIMYLAHPEYFSFESMGIVSDSFGHIEISSKAKPVNVCVSVKQGMLYHELEKIFG